MTSIQRPTVEEVAEAGHVATDKYGNALISIDEAAEARLRRKLDLILLPPVSLIYLFCFIDRANVRDRVPDCAYNNPELMRFEYRIQIGNARLAGLEKNLKLVGYDYNILLTAFYVAVSLLTTSAVQSSSRTFPLGLLRPLFRC